MKPKGRYNIRIARRHGCRSSKTHRPEVSRTSWQSTGKRSSVTPCRKVAALLSHPDALALGREPRLAVLRRVRGHATRDRAGRLLRPAGDHFSGDPSFVHRNVMAPYLLHFDIMCRARALGTSGTTSGASPRRGTRPIRGVRSASSSGNSADRSSRSCPRSTTSTTRSRTSATQQGIPRKLQPTGRHGGGLVRLITRDVSRAVPGRREPGSRPRRALGPSGPRLKARPERR